MTITVNAGNPQEIFEGFGASGAWWAQIVGGWAHTQNGDEISVRDRISALLYSREQGIGLTIYRYNIGAGSKYSAGGSFSEPARSTESFLIGDGRYDMSRDANAVYMMRLAVRDGARDVVLFVNSPPVQMTKNGKAHQDKNKIFRENISPRRYRDFATYCLDVTEYFLREGLPIKYLSPVNEPVWMWNGGQEGCFYRPSSVQKVFEVFSREMNNRELLNNVKLSGAEAGDLRFFNKSYTRHLLKNPEVLARLDGVDVHSYCQPAPISLLNDRLSFTRRFYAWMQKNYAAMPIKVSEWTHMQGGRDRGMQSAMVAANTIFDDLDLMHAVSWQHWIAVSEVDFCDGLIYIDLYKKTYEMTKRYYATGNFSKYIRPGAVRIDSACDDAALKVISYLCDGRTVTVVLNNAETHKHVSLPHRGEMLHALTDREHDLAERTVTDGEILLPPMSVSTFVYEAV